MAKPGPKSGGDHSEQREEANQETLWYHASKGNQKAKDAISTK